MAYTFKHGDRPLDEYTIQRAVGRGGFGEVYYAVSDGGREVALKFLLENPQIELRGVSHCINLKSPHLVSIFDVKKTSEGDYAIIMEYCSGPSLRDLLIAEPAGFGPQKAAFFASEIAKGLAYLHERGIVHRDLKPGNIFYDDGYVKIGDYGLSKFIAVSRHSAQTASVGTVHYMAPEIGSGNYSRGVDIYALGVMLYEMLLGKVPFEGSSMAEILMKHLTAQPELDDLPQPFGKVIRKALEKDPKDRYQTVEEMVDDLLAGEDIKKSVAGFRPHSLSGAVRRGAGDLADSPYPSPNPPPHGAGGFPPPPPGGGNRDRGARGYSPGAAMPLPERVAKRFDRVSRRIDRRIAKLAAKHGIAPPGVGQPRDERPVEDRREAAAPGSGRAPWAKPAPPRGERAKRFSLIALLTIGLAVGYGILVGNAMGCAEFGVGAGALVVGMWVAIGLGRAISTWFTVQDGPRWAQRLIYACCGAALLAPGCGPYFVEVGLGLWVGLIVVVAFARWDRTLEHASDGEISFGRVLWTAFGAGVATAIAHEITNCCGSGEDYALIAAGIAGIATFLIQAGASWNFHREHRVQSGATTGEARAAQHHMDVGTGAANLEEAPLTPSDAAAPFAVAEEPTTPQSTSVIDPNAPKPRWISARMAWSVIAFILMGGAIVTFLMPLLATRMSGHNLTAAIVTCCGFTAYMIFALRKTTPLKRIGFWRETLRPFLISTMLFSVGGTITGIAREWDCSGDHWASGSELRSIISHEYESAMMQAEVMTSDRNGRIAHPAPAPPAIAISLHERFEGRCLDDGGRIALVSGLVLSSIALIFLQFFTGGRPRPPKPFLQDTDSDHKPELPADSAEPVRTPPVSGE